MSKRRGKASVNHSIGGLFTFALLGVFAVLSMLLVLLGVDAYRSIIDTTDRNNDVRASMSYIANKVRSCESKDQLRIDQLDGADMLVIVHTMDGDTYETRIFRYEGALQECLFDPSDDEFDPEYGEEIVDILDFSAEWTDERLITISVTTLDGRTHQLSMGMNTET